MDDVVIEPLRLRDAEATRLLGVASFPSPTEQPDFADELERPVTRCLIAKDRATGAVVGYALGWLLLGELEVVSIAVAADQKRRGIGRLLLDHLLELARYESAMRVFLEVRPSNGAAIALYQARGFEAVGRRRAYYRDGEDAITMALDLA